MVEGTAVDLAGAGLEESSPVEAGELQRVVGAPGVDEEGFDGIAAVALRTGRAGEL
jgi:hypothetical protein